MKKIIVVLLLCLLISASAPVGSISPRGSSCGIGNPGEGWDCFCKGDIILSESIYGFEVWVKCDMPEMNFGKSQDWERGCYGNVIVYAIPGVRNILCIEWGIP
jgi:hypothetical protein